MPKYSRRKFQQPISPRSYSKKIKMEICDNIYTEYYPQIDNDDSQDDTKQGHWSGEEDKILIEIVKAYGPHNWEKNSVYHPSRNGKQMRERWLSHLKG
ncbi:2139_t:CDS:2, partial [Paraglomus occultum]